MKKYFILVFCILLFGSCSFKNNSINKINRLEFSPSKLAGRWVENYSTQQACSQEQSTKAFKFSADGKRVTLVFNKPKKTAFGAVSELSANIISSTKSTLTIQYEGEKRLKKSGEPVQWELALVAPGVYRWRETDWEKGEVTIVVGIRCRAY